MRVLNFRIITPGVSALIVFLFGAAMAGAAVPGVPSGLTAIAGNGEASLSWEAVSGATAYVVSRGVDSGGPFSFVAQTQGAGFSNRGLINGTASYYVVAALNAEGQSADSAPVSVVPTTAVLAAPINVGVVPGRGQASLKWDAVTSAVSYNVFRATARGGPYTQLSPAAPGPSFTDTGITDGTPYYYVVQTMSTNTGAYSDEVMVTPSGLLPSAPTNFSASPGSTWAALLWNPSAGATGYAVYRATQTGGPWTFVGLSQTTGYEDTALSNGTTYYYAVAAVNAAGQGAFSAQASAAVEANEKPHAPVISALKTGTQQIQLNWDNPPGAVSYTVYSSTSSGGPYTSLGVQTPGYADTGLVNGTTYFYVVDAHNASATTARSNEVAAMPVAILPPPSNVSAIAGNTEATVTWHPVTGATGYYVAVYDDPGATSYVTGGPSGGAGFTAVGLTNDVTYYVKVQSVGGAVSPASGVVAVTPSADVPLAPANLAAPTAGNTQVDLTWSPSADAEGYMVFRRTESAPWPTVPVATVSGTLFTDAGLVNDTRYFYTVSAFNTNGTGARTPYEAVAVPVAVAPMAPTDIRVVAGNTEATVLWRPVAGAGDYYVTIATSLGGIYASGGPSGQGSYTATGLTNGVPYYVRVQAMAPSATSASSVEAVVTPAVSLPLAPQNVGVTNAGNTQVSVQWSPVPGATGYRVFRRTTGGMWPTPPLATLDGTLFTDTGLDNRVRYSYLIGAENAAGAGAWSAVAATGTPVATVPLAPTGPTALAGNTQATITWQPVVGATDYYVTVAETPGGPYFNGGSAGGQLSYKATGLTNGQSYHFRIQASADAASAYSKEVTAQPSAALPLAPDGFSAPVVGNTQVSLTWNPLAGATTYHLYRRSPGMPWTAVPVADASGTLYTATGLVNGNAYIYVVAAENGGGVGAWSGNEITVTPSGASPLAPVNVTAVSGDAQVTVAWDAVAGATNYYVTAADTPGGPYVAGGSAGAQLSHPVTGLTNDQPYYFRVQASAGGPWSAFSTETGATPSLPADHGTISGRVSVNVAGHSDLGVANATVRLQGTAYAASTDVNGGFSLAGIPFGDYVIAISAPGLDPFTTAVSLTGASLPVTLPQLTFAQISGVQGDANGNGQLGLEDAVYVLQVMTGAR